MPSNLQTVNVIWIIKWKNIFAVDRRRCAQHCNTGTSHSGYNLFWQSRKFFFFPIFCRCFFFFFFLFVLFCLFVEGWKGSVESQAYWGLVGWFVCFLTYSQAAHKKVSSCCLWDQRKSRKLLPIWSRAIKCSAAQYFNKQTHQHQLEV